MIGGGHRPLLAPALDRLRHRLQNMHVHAEPLRSPRSALRSRRRAAAAAAEPPPLVLAVAIARMLRLACSPDHLVLPISLSLSRARARERERDGQNQVIRRAREPQHPRDRDREHKRRRLGGGGGGSAAAAQGGPRRAQRLRMDMHVLQPVAEPIQRWGEERTMAPTDHLLSRIGLRAPTYTGKCLGKPSAFLLYNMHNMHMCMYNMHM